MILQGKIFSKNGLGNGNLPEDTDQDEEQVNMQEDGDEAEASTSSDV
jgi:hypothetical protein